MVALKQNSLNNFLNKPDEQARFILIYGPDRGLVHERLKNLRDHFLKGNEDPFSHITLEASDMIGDQQRLADEIFTVSMFGGLRLIEIRHIEGQNIAPILKPLLSSKFSDSIILLQAGDLKKTNALRKLFEADKRAVALACFQDNETSINAIINDTIQKNGMTVDTETRRLIHSLLGSDREASRQELEKLVLYCHNTKQITSSQVIAIMGNVSTILLDDVIDAAFLGNFSILDQGIERLIANGQNPNTILLIALKHGQLLHRLAGSVKMGVSITDAMKSARPPIFFKRENTIRQQMKCWRPDQLHKVLNHIDTVMLQTRQQPILELGLTQGILLKIARAAQTLQSR